MARHAPARILITDAETRAVVAVLRGLSTAGFYVVAAADSGSRPAPGQWSRSADERLLAPHPITDEAEFVGALEQALSGGGFSALIAGGEGSLLAISRARERLEQHVCIGLPEHETVVRSLDKREVMSAASRHGLTSPDTVACSGVEEAVQAAGTLGFPVALKPVQSIVGEDGSRCQLGSILVPDAETLRRVAGAYGDPCLVQDGVSGSVLSFAGVLAEGRLLGEALSRYERTWYPEAGSATFSRTVPMPPTLRERAVALLNDIGWEGIFELELIERLDGDWAAIDLNPRPYGSLALAIGAGANLPALWCEHLLGREPDPVSARPGVCYRWEDADLRYALRKLRAGDTASVLTVLRPRRGVVHPYFEADDPGPFMARSLFLAGTAVRRAIPFPRPANKQDVRDPITRRGRSTVSRSSSSRGPTVIIGAGPYGLAGAAHLRDAGIETRSFGEPLDFWRRQMPVGMMLRSLKRSTNISDPRRTLTIESYEQAKATRVHTPNLRLEEFIDYGLWFQQQVAPDLDSRRVTSVTQATGGFRVVLSDGEELHAPRVVVAAGLSPFARYPEPFASLPRSLASHTFEHDDLAFLGGKQVLVIGGGQSALESAALLHELGANVEVLIRRPSIKWLADDPTAPPPPPPRINIPLPPTDVGGRVSGWIAAAPDVYRWAPGAVQPWVSVSCTRPAGSGWLRPRLEAVPLTYEVSPVAAEASDGGVSVRLSDGSARHVDHVLLGTGYQIDATKYPFLAPELIREIAIAGGYPLLGPGLESSVPGLHFLGAPAALSFGPIMRFVVGTWYAAPALARRAQGRRQSPIRFSF